MSRLLDSLTKGADTLRDLFPGKVTEKVRSHPQFKVRWTLLTRAENEINNLVGFINGCDDWTSDKFKSSEIFRMMFDFLSATSVMPKGISFPFQKVRSLCQERMRIIAGKSLDRHHPKIQELLDGQDYKDMVDSGDITPPFTWNGSIKELANWLDNAIDLRKPMIDQVDGKEERRDWMIVDGVFLKDGKPVTAKQLGNAIKH